MRSEGSVGAPQLLLISEHSLPCNEQVEGQDGYRLDAAVHLALGYDMLQLCTSAEDKFKWVNQTGTVFLLA